MAREAPRAIQGHRPPPLRVLPSAASLSGHLPSPRRLLLPSRRSRRLGDAGAVWPGVSRISGQAQGVPQQPPHGRALAEALHQAPVQSLALLHHLVLREELVERGRRLPAEERVERRRPRRDPRRSWTFSARGAPARSHAGGPPAARSAARAAASPRSAMLAPRYFCGKPSPPPPASHRALRRLSSAGPGVRAGPFGQGRRRRPGAASPGFQGG